VYWSAGPIYRDWAHLRKPNLDGGNVAGCQAFRTFGDIEFHALTFGQRFVSIYLDR
jgi:hypothetical protein